MDVSDLTSSSKKSAIRVLHVDDDLSLIGVSKQILTMENNFEIDTATSVDEAFKKMEIQTYDAIVSDYEMPQKNGLDFLRELRDQKNEIPFILFTGKGREEVVVKALNLGADRYINKNGFPETVYCELADAINKTVESKKAKKALAESELQYRTVVEKSLQGILITQTSPLRLVFANESMSKILGYSIEELKSLSPLGVAGLIHDEDKPVFFGRLESRLHGELANSSLEFRAVRKNGSIVWLEAFASRIEYMGQPAVQGMFLDIDERKKGSEILRESEARYRELANSLPDIVFESDTIGKLEFINEKALEIAGISHEDYEKGLNILQFLVPQDRQRALKNIQRLLAGGKYVPDEYTFLRKDGTTFPALITTTLRISKNKVTGLRGLVINITERKKNEAILRENEKQFSQLFSSMPSGVAIYEPVDNGEDFVFRNFNAAAEKIERISKENVIGKRVTQVFAGVKSFGILEVFQRVLRTGKPEYYPVALYKDDKEQGSWRENWVYKLPNGNIIAIYNDITERTRLEIALQEKLDMLEALTENIGAGFVTINRDYRILYANKFVKNNVGNVEGKLCYATLNTLGHVCPDCGVKKVFEKGVAKDSHEYSQIGLDGKPYYVELIATPLKDKDGNVTTAVEFVVDVGEKKHMQQKLRANEEKFRAISDSAIDAIFLFNAKDEITYWNPAAERIFGYTKTEIIGKKVDATIVPPNYREHYLGLKTKLSKGENKNIEGEILEFPALRKDETELLLEFSITPTQLNGERHFVAIARDITERKKAEETLNRTMNELVSVNEKLNVVGGLSRHDVRNKLLAVTGYAFLLKKKHPDQADIMDGLDKMEHAVKEIEAIFDFAKMYEQIGVEELTYIDAEETLKEALELSSAFSSFKVNNDCHGLTLLADSFLRQLFFNLMDNSLKHGQRVTRISVRFEKADQDELALIYEDDGVGVPADNKPKLFKSRFSTSGSTGNGLYLIRRMIEVYGWAIQENGEPGKGAKFTILIPKFNQKGKENYRIG